MERPGTQSMDPPETSSMDRRAYLAVLGSGVATGLAGCTLPGSGGPNPAVLDHVQGDPTVVETKQVHPIGGSSRTTVQVRNDGHPGVADVSLWWVGRVGLEPEGRSPAELREMGYRHARTRRLTVGTGERESVTFEADQPRGVAGYFVRAANRTYGAVVENRGEAGPVSVAIVDTTDMSDQRVMASRTVDLPGGRRKPVTFTLEGSFESFRVDASAAA